jgi:predicted small lipoprotein YifL
MKKHLKLFGLILLLALLLALVSCGSDDGQLLSSFTGESPKGPLAFWDSNMTWGQDCWQ